MEKGEGADQGDIGAEADFVVSILGVKGLQPTVKPVSLRQEKGRPLTLKGAAGKTKTLTDYFSWKGLKPAAPPSQEPTAK